MKFMENPNKGNRMDGCVSVVEAAKIKNVTRQAIYLAIRLNRLKAYRHNNRWKVFVGDLKDYDEKRYSRMHHGEFKDEIKRDFDDGYYTVRYAAKMINIPHQKLYYAIRSGKVKAKRKKSAYMIHVSDLMKYESTVVRNVCTENTA